MSGHLFLYGTLLPGLVRPPVAALVARLRPVGPASVPGRLYDLGPYPGLVPDPAARVRGELSALPDDAALLAALDEYEGYDPADPSASLYRRVETVAALDDGRAVACWVYQYNGDVGRAVRIEDGDYREWCRMGFGRPVGR